MRLLFRNRYAALLWVCLALFSAANFVRRGGGHEQLTAASRMIAARHHAVEVPPPEHRVSFDAPDAEPELPAGFLPDPAHPGRYIGPDGKRYRMRVNSAAER